MHIFFVKGSRCLWNTAELNVPQHSTRPSGTRKHRTVRLTEEFASQFRIAPIALPQNTEANNNPNVFS